MGCAYSKTCIGQICATKENSIRQTHQQAPARSGTKATTATATAAAEEDNPVFNFSSDAVDDEEDDEIHQLSLSRDQEWGITRLSRVSSQFLPPDGSRIVKVPSCNYELRYSFLSQRGYYPDALDKANQDSFAIHTPFGSNSDDHFFGVFDGHGEFGTQCSQFVKRRLCENLLRHGRFRVDPAEACNAAFLSTNSQLHADVVDDSMSGTTAITVMVRGRTIYVANAGDSRAVLAEKRDGDLVAVDLSIDQTPFRPDELERVKLCGARVLTLDQIEGLKNPDVQCWGTEEDDDGDPPRLWVPNGMYPGTAFTRSIGDSIAETIGVVANPEIAVIELTPDNPFFVVASDGVFEFISSQTVVDMVAKHKDPRDACAAIVAESYRLWLQYETRTDDITIIVVHIHGLKDDAPRQLSSTGTLLQAPIPQVVELTGSESPSTFGWNSTNQRVRHDLSRARIRAIESSLENGHVWVPPSPGHRKTWEEEAHIERVLRDHFLFRKLTDSQCQVLLDCMQRLEVNPGDVIVKQGGEGDCFYVVGSGEFEVLATQDEMNGEVPRILQRYSAEKQSSFGELALMHNKPLQASVRAVDHGTLWALKREDFRGILMSEFSNLASLKLLRSVDLLSRLTILQLSHVAESLSEACFSDGQTIVNKDEKLQGLYVIQKGLVKISFGTEVLESQNVSSLKTAITKEYENLEIGTEVSIEKQEGSYFGEWALLGELKDSLSVVAVGEVVCVVLTKENFDSAVGPLTNLPADSHKSRHSSFDLSRAKVTDTTALAKATLADLEWTTCLSSTDCSEIGLVHLKDKENLFSLKRFSKQKVKKLGKEAQVLKERNLMKNLLKPSAFVPQILCTCVDQTFAAILLNTTLACPLSSLLHSPLDESSARFIIASLVSALEDIHKNEILFRGSSPELLMLDQSGHLQIVDFRFAKKLSGERTFTICGNADYLAPEIVQGKGHGFAADWWALGVLIYYMLEGEKPFGSWRDSELDTFQKIAKGQLTFPRALSSEAEDLITKLLEVDENLRFGSQGGPESIKKHPWFNEIKWGAISNREFQVPEEIISRIHHHLENDNVLPLETSQSMDITDDQDAQNWLEEW
ncbi:Protein phosphatase 2C and cyclic nucleotide-binding/kinase domain-containing protein [Cardamine amara subsp. amara]|uniref:protein-serine/threonine phosphatase n=1 Tax=Cardamine amara subsp. amara TaxID=228776 RepID=A0ABD1A2T1_CARAN